MKYTTHDLVTKLLKDEPIGLDETSFYGAEEYMKETLDRTAIFKDLYDVDKRDDYIYDKELNIDTLCPISSKIFFQSVGFYRKSNL